MTVTGFIDDGCAEHVFVKGIFGIYPELRLIHRPITESEKNHLLQRVDARLKARQDTTPVVAEEMAKRFSDWTLQDRQGGTLPINADNLCRLKPALFERLYGILLGIDGGDPDPEKTEEPNGSTGTERQEGREKN